MPEKTIKRNERKHFYALNGLRGVASIGVITCHLINTIYCYDPFSPYFNHGYLLVEFFFVVSGFILSYAYDNQKDSLTAIDFLKRRYFKLQPLAILTSFISSLFLKYLDVTVVHKDENGNVPLKLRALLILCAMFNIPAPKSLNYCDSLSMFPLNPPQWSLFFEYVGSILYVTIFRYLPTIALVILTSLSSVGTFFIIVTSKNGYLSNGFTVTDPYVALFGIIRFLTPFLVGQVMSRIFKEYEIKKEKKRKDGKKVFEGFSFPLLFSSFVLFILINTPSLRKEGGTKVYNALFETFSIIIILPIIVLIAINEKENKIKGREIIRSVEEWIGGISYSVYLSHYIFIDFIINWVKKNNLTFDYVKGIFFGIIILSLALGNFYNEVFDRPLQKWINKYLI